MLNNLIDDHGRLWGRFNIIDLSFGIILLAMLSGLLWVFLGQSPLEKKIQARGEATVVVAVRGARVLDTSVLKEGEQVYLTIRNQRYKPVKVTKIKHWQRKSVFLGSDNQPVVIDDPTSPEVRDVDLTFTLGAQVTNEGIVADGHHLKTGNSVELDAFGYRFNGSIMQVDFAAQ